MLLTIKKLHRYELVRTSKCQCHHLLENVRMRGKEKDVVITFWGASAEDMSFAGQPRSWSQP